MSIKLFQNILAYRLTDAAVIHGHGLDDLNELLGQHQARLPASQELGTIGFSLPVGEQDSFIERVAGTHYSYVLAVRSHERMLPGKVVRAEVAARVRQIEERDARKVYAREKRQLKDEVIQQLLPRAFIDTKITYVLIAGPCIYIDTSSAKRGMDVLDLLRTAFGSLPVRPVSVKGTPIDIFTRWALGDDSPDFLSLTGDFKASGRSDESDLLTGKGVDLGDEELNDALRSSGRRITQLGLMYHTAEPERVATFTLNEMLGMKGIKWDDSLTEQVRDEIGDNKDDEAGVRRVTELRATFMLLTAAIRELWKALLNELGGEDIPAKEGLDALDERHEGWGGVEGATDDEEDLV